MLVSALAYSLLWVVRGGGNIKDQFYWLTKYELLESGWLACGTIAIGHAWMALFGHTIFAMRVLGWLCTTLAVALPYCCLLSRRQRSRNLHWLGLTYWLVAYGSFQEFSPGTISVLLLSILCVVLLKSPISNLKSPISIGLLLALLVLVRFPNVLVLPILALWCYYLYRRDKEQLPILVRQALITLLVAAVAYGLGLVAWYYGMHHDVTAPAARHTMELMLQKMGENGYRLVADLALWLAFAYGLSIAGRPIHTAWKWFAAVASGGLMLYYVIYAYPASQWYSIDQVYLISSLVLFVALVLYRQRERHDLPMPVMGCALALMSVATLGTDTGFLKLFPALLCLLPWWAAYIQWPCRQRYVLTAMVVLTALFVVRFSTNAIGRHNIYEENTWGQVPVMHLTQISEQDNAQMVKLCNDYAVYSRKAKVYAVGDAMHMFRAITHCEPPVRNEFWSNIFDPVYTRWYSELVAREHPVIFCFYSPSFHTKPQYRDRESMLEHMLLDSGYVAVDRSDYKYMIYVKE